MRKDVESEARVCATAEDRRHRASFDEARKKDRECGGELLDGPTCGSEAQIVKTGRQARTGTHEGRSTVWRRRSERHGKRRGEREDAARSR